MRISNDAAGSKSSHHHLNIEDGGSEKQAASPRSPQAQHAALRSDRMDGFTGLMWPLKQGEHAHGNMAHKCRRSDSAGLCGELEVGGRVDWQLCLKPAPARPQDLCELNLNAAAAPLCKKAERMGGWMVGREKRSGEKKQNENQGEERGERGRPTKNTMRDYICSSSDGALLN